MAGRPRAAERAIFNIVGWIRLHVGRSPRAVNVEGGNSREANREKRARSGIRKQILTPADRAQKKLCLQLIPQLPDLPGELVHLAFEILGIVHHHLIDKDRVGQ